MQQFEKINESLKNCYENINKSSFEQSVVDKINQLSIDINEILVASIEQQSITNDVIEIIDEMQKSISETVSTLEENIENIREFSELSSNIKDNIAN